MSNDFARQALRAEQDGHWRAVVHADVCQLGGRRTESRRAAPTTTGCLVLLLLADHKTSLTRQTVFCAFPAHERFLASRGARSSASSTSLVENAKNAQLLRSSGNVEPNAKPLQKAAGANVKATTSSTASRHESTTGQR